MKIDILTIFPDFFRGPLDYGIVRRARETGLVEIGIHDLRAFTKDKHRTVDDRPFGGGEGMVLKPEPIFECLESLGDVASREMRLRAGAPQSVILLSAQGRRLDQTMAADLSALSQTENGRIVLICGRYEGVDERISEHLADREVSIGDYVLSGGELGAAVIVDTVTRLIHDFRMSRQFLYQLRSFYSFEDAIDSSAQQQRQRPSLSKRPGNGVSVGTQLSLVAAADPGNRHLHG